MKPPLSTSQVAAELGIAKRTLLRWLYDGKLPEVTRQSLGGIELRIWNKRDLERARKFKDENYRKRNVKKGRK
jgi:predicted site-specific integrase-resolvase